jgi:hypothetical protein
LWCLLRRSCSINGLFLVKTCWQYTQECICKRQMYIEYRVTFNELNVQSVPDILKTLQNLFDSILTDVTKGIQEEDLVQITLNVPIWIFPSDWTSPCPRNHISFQFHP